MAEKPDEKVVRLPPENVLLNTIKKVRSVASFVSGKRGELAEVMSKAIEDHKLHKKAFKVAVMVDKMDEDDRRLFWTHLDDYREKLKLDVYEQTDIEDFTGKPGEGAKPDDSKPWPDDVATGKAGQPVN